MADFDLDDLELQQHTATARLHLLFTGRTHGLLLDLMDKLSLKLSRVADEEGSIDPQEAGCYGPEYLAIKWRIGWKQKK